MTGIACHLKKDYCSSTTSICKNGGKCSMKPDGNYQCSCLAGILKRY